MPQLSKRTEDFTDSVIISKTYSITGRQLEYIITPIHITETARKVHDFLTVGAAAPLQEAVETALKFEDAYYIILQKSYAENVISFLKDSISYQL